MTNYRKVKISKKKKKKSRADITPKVSGGDRRAQGMSHGEKLLRIMGTWEHLFCLASSIIMYTQGEL